MITNVRERPNKRFSVRFYVFGPSAVSEPTVDAMGQLESELSQYCKGIFAKEKPRSPREIREGDRVVNEQESILIGTWTKTISLVSHGMFCFIPTLRKVYAVNGNATDPHGDRKTIHISIVDNVTQDITQRIPGAIM